MLAALVSRPSGSTSRAFGRPLPHQARRLWSRVGCLPYVPRSDYFPLELLKEAMLYLWLRRQGKESEAPIARDIDLLWMEDKIVDSHCGGILNAVL